MWNSLKCAISTYSIFPVFNVKWDKDKTKYSIGFFPIVGIFIGGIMYLWIFLSYYLNLNSILSSMIATFIPVIFTGGIHIDGYMDTIDAIASHKSAEDKLKIMKDSHVGSFSVLYLVMYFAVIFSLWTNVIDKYCYFAVPLYILSRGISGLSALLLPHARSGGMLDSMIDKKKNCSRTINIFLLTLFIIFSGFSMYILHIEIIKLICVFTSALVWFLIYRLYCLKTLGGVTGDTSGWFLSIAELIFLGVFSLF